MPGQGMCSNSQVGPRHTCNVLDASYNFHVPLGLRDSCGFLSVVIHASAGVATSALAMACAWEAHYLSACALTRLGIFPDPPSICGDSDLRNLY